MTMYTWQNVNPNFSAISNSMRAAATTDRANAINNLSNMLTDFKNVGVQKQKDLIARNDAAIKFGLNNNTNASDINNYSVNALTQQYGKDNFTANVGNNALATINSNIAAKRNVDSGTASRQLIQDIAQNTSITPTDASAYTQQISGLNPSDAASVSKYLTGIQTQQGNVSTDQLVKGALNNVTYNGSGKNAVQQTDAYKQLNSANQAKVMGAYNAASVTKSKLSPEQVARQANLNQQITQDTASATAAYHTATNQIAIKSGYIPDNSKPITVDTLTKLIAKKGMNLNSTNIGKIFTMLSTEAQKVGIPLTEQNALGILTDTTDMSHNGVMSWLNSPAEAKASILTNLKLIKFRKNNYLRNTADLTAGYTNHMAQLNQFKSQIGSDMVKNNFKGTSGTSAGNYYRDKKVRAAAAIQARADRAAAAKVAARKTAAENAAKLIAATTARKAAEAAKQTKINSASTKAADILKNIIPVQKVAPVSISEFSKLTLKQQRARYEKNTLAIKAKSKNDIIRGDAYAANLMASSNFKHLSARDIAMTLSVPNSSRRFSKTTAAKIYEAWKKARHSK